LADERVADIQRELKEQGFYYGQITGQKDADTIAAIRRFQIRNGLQITGELDDETLKSIKSTASNTPQSAPANRVPATTAPAAPDTSDLRAETAPPDPAINSVPVQPYSPNYRGQWQPPGPDRMQPLSPGHGMFAGTPYETAPIEIQRKVIADAQRILARRGLFKDPVDGAYGPTLEFSLRAYQSRVGLPLTGRLDLETLAALQLLPGAHAPVFTPRRPMGPAETPLRGEWVRP
jgi:peptidoglycan hydrolase-like protein with peptidoglycan-binding domain